MDILLKSDARKTKENSFFFSEGPRMLTCRYMVTRKCKCHSRLIRVCFSFLVLLCTIIMTKALLYLKQFLKIYNPLALFILPPTHRREIGKAHN